MATWNDLRQYIYSRYQVTQEAPGVIRVHETDKLQVWAKTPGH